MAGKTGNKVNSGKNEKEQVSKKQNKNKNLLVPEFYMFDKIILDTSVTKP